LADNAGAADFISYLELLLQHYYLVPHLGQSASGIAPGRSTTDYDYIIQFQFFTGFFHILPNLIK